jgi:hypothetical protein
MIVQTALEGAPRLVITMVEHGAFAGRLARAFGNEAFEPVAPRDEMLYVIDHHDWGWREIDERPGRTPATGLPWNLAETPRALSIRTLEGSPDFNEAHHPYCGLLSAMHMWGVYMGRYGLSDDLLIDLVPQEHRPAFDAALERLVQRQARLREQLARDPETAAWVEDGHLFQNYKQLQFFDTLALYFNFTGAADRRPAQFGHVPRSAGEDATVAIRPVDEVTYALAPFPFSTSGIRVSFCGRSMSPVSGDDEDLRETLRRAPMQEQTVRLVAA